MNPNKFETNEIAAIGVDALSVYCIDAQEFAFVLIDAEGQYHPFHMSRNKLTRVFAQIGVALNPDAINNIYK